MASTFINPIVVSPGFSSDLTVLAGTVNGMMKSVDGGSTWTKHSLVKARDLQDNFVRFIAISPYFTHDQTVFVGSNPTNGMYRSVDGGETYESINTGLPANPTVNSLAISPDFALDHSLFVGVNYQGIYRSTDVGNSWEPSNIGIETSMVLSIKISKNFVMFAATDGEGIFKSEDGGASWFPVSEGLKHMRINSLAISPNYENDQVIFAGAVYGGLYRTTDGGAHWEDISEGLLPNIIQRVACSPDYAKDQTVFVGSYYGVYRSVDGGNSWSYLSYLHRYEDISGLIGYEGDWQEQKSDAASGSSLRSANTPGDLVTFRFYGEKVRWIGSRGPNHGKAKVFIDEQFKGVIDLYSPTFSLDVLYLERDLASDFHTISIEVVSEKNENSVNYIVTFDAFEVETQRLSGVFIDKVISDTPTEEVEVSQDHASLAVTDVGELLVVWSRIDTADGSSDQDSIWARYYRYENGTWRTTLDEYGKEVNFRIDLQRGDRHVHRIR